jgi:quinolinate synthase
MGVDVARMPVWDPRKPHGGNSAEILEDARVVLWRGWCSVHQRFTVDQIAQARAKNPDVRVVVHPECPMEVVDAADEAGSTQYIQKAVDAAPAGTAFAIGTEINMVRRLADTRPDLTIECLDPVVCPCSTMYRIHPAYLAWVLESLVEGRVVNQVSVAADVAGHARTAVERMLAVHP